MFHKIAQMYRDIKKQEKEESTSLIINICANLNSKKSSLVHTRFGIVILCVLGDNNDVFFEFRLAQIFIIIDVASSLSFSLISLYI